MGTAASPGAEGGTADGGRPGARRSRRAAGRCRAEGEVVAGGEEAAAVAEAEPAPAPAEPAPAPAPVPEGFVPVLLPGELPKGERKEVMVDDKPIMLYWYRNKIRALESRSPAEGYYSEGFMSAKFTQDGCITCPTTESLFSIETGEVVDWYPTNPVLRRLTPKETCRPVEVYEVHVTESAICVNPNGSLSNWTSGSALRQSFTMPGGAPTSKGGSDTSLENNNVFSVEPTMYVEGSSPGTPAVETGERVQLKPATVIAGTTGVAIVAVAGTALCLFPEPNIPALVAFWALFGGGTGFAIYKSQFAQGNEDGY